MTEELKGYFKNFVLFFVAAFVAMFVLQFLVTNADNPQWQKVALLNSISQKAKNFVTSGQKYASSVVDAASSSNKEQSVPAVGSKEVTIARPGSSLPIQSGKNAPAAKSGELISCMGKNCTVPAGSPVRFSFTTPDQGMQQTLKSRVSGTIFGIAISGLPGAEVVIHSTNCKPSDKSTTTAQSLTAYCGDGSSLAISLK